MGEVGEVGEMGFSGFKPCLCTTGQSSGIRQWHNQIRRQFQAEITFITTNVETLQAWQWRDFLDSGAVIMEMPWNNGNSGKLKQCQERAQYQALTSTVSLRNSIKLSLFRLLSQRTFLSQSLKTIPCLNELMNPIILLNITHCVLEWLSNQSFLKCIICSYQGCYISDLSMKSGKVLILQCPGYQPIKFIFLTLYYS